MNIDSSAGNTATIAVAERAEDETRRQRLFDRYAWLACGAIGMCGLGISLLVLPHTREDQTLGQFLFKIFIFVAAISAISLAPRFSRTGWLVTSIPFLLFLGYIIPKITYWFLHGPQTEPEYYTVMWSLCYPGIILSLCLAWRQAGGPPGRAIKIGLNGLVLVFSGYLEWMWFRANPDMNYYDMKTIPHIEVIIGSFPSYGGLFLFMMCHVPILVAINYAPIDRWIDRLRTGAAPSAGQAS